MIVNNNTTMIPRHVKHRAMTTTWPRHKPQEWSQGSPERLKMAGGCRRNPLICHTGGQNHGSPCVPIKSTHFTYANNCAYIYIFTYIYIYIYCLHTYIHIYIYIHTYIYIYSMVLYIYMCVYVCFFIFISDIIWIFAHLFMIRCLCIYLLMCLRIYHCLFPYIYIYYSFTLLCAFVCVGPFLFSWSFKKISAPSLLMIPHFFSRLAASTNRK